MKFKVNTKKPKFTKKTKKPKASKEFVKKVQAIVHKDVETKQIFTNQYNLIQNYNSGINSSGDCSFVVANMAQGTGDNARIGDQVRAQKLTVKGYIITRFVVPNLGTYYNASRIACRLFLVQSKTYAGQSNISTNATTWMSTLLKKGGTTSGFTGSLNDLYAPINTDAITSYYDKVFYINNPYSNAVFGSAGNSFVMLTNTTKFFNININLRNKLLKFDSSIDSGLTPVNFNPTLLLGYCYLDGTSADTATQAIAMSWESFMDYEDA